MADVLGGLWRVQRSGIFLGYFSLLVSILLSGKVCILAVVYGSFLMEWISDSL